MSRPCIAFIGAGQFGSRLLQGLTLCEQPLQLYLVDPTQVPVMLRKVDC